MPQYMGKYNFLTKKKIVHLPIKKRLQAYQKTLKLKDQGLKTIEIWKALQKERIEIKYETLRSWVKGDRNPLKKLNTIIKNKELPYIIGILIGDGCFYKVIKKGSYAQGRIVLGVKEKELAEKFTDSVYKILHKKKKYTVRWSNAQRVYIVEFSSKELVEYLSKSLSELKEEIKINPKGFLTGIFDAEGSISIKFQKGRIYPRIFLTNSDTELIEYVKILLTKFKISSTIQKNTIKGKEKTILGKKTFTNNTCYNLSIENIKGVKKFANIIKFNIKRKQRRLKKSLDLINKKGNKISKEMWKKLIN